MMIIIIIYRAYSHDSIDRASFPSVAGAEIGQCKTLAHTIKPGLGSITMINYNYNSITRLNSVSITIIICFRPKFQLQLQLCVPTITIIIVHYKCCRCPKIMNIINAGKSSISLLFKIKCFVHYV